MLLEERLGMATSNRAAQSTDGRIAILAGSGRLPPLLNETLASKGQGVFVVNMTPQRGGWLAKVNHANIPVTQISKLIRALRNAKVSTLVFAGGIRVRPKIWDFLLDWRMYREFPGIYRALQQGDDALLRAAIGLMERYGFVIIGAHEVAPSLLAPDTIMTKRRPTASELLDAKIAINAALELGRSDIGQAAVVRSGQVIGREDRSGTASMLLNLSTKTPSQPSGVLAKWSKPNQELRVDLPSIGPDTIAQLQAAGLSGVVIEAGRSLILDCEDVIRLADENNLFVVGMRNNH
jgi:UDP-2,3-diacylglucosamine hydrolase